MVLFSSLEHIFTTIKTKFKISIFCIFTGPYGGTWNLQTPCPVQGGSNELISKFLSSMILYNHSSYFKSGEINSCKLSPLPISNWDVTSISNAMNLYNQIKVSIIEILDLNCLPYQSCPDINLSCLWTSLQYQTDADREGLSSFFFRKYLNNDVIMVQNVTVAQHGCITWLYQ